MARTRNNGKLRVAAYGFDEAGFRSPSGQSESSWETDSTVITWVPYQDPQRLDQFDAVITPQGIFEEISYRDTFTGTRGVVKCDRDLLLERDRQVRNLAEKGGWICILVEAVVDEVPDGSGYGRETVDDSDLCKLILNALRVRRQPYTKGLSGCRAVRNEFIEYVRNHGIAKTIFEARDRNSTTSLIEHGSAQVGIEVARQFFFLPFVGSRREFELAKEVISVAVDSVAAYRLKTNEEVPPWTDQLRFARETELLQRSKQVQKELSEILAEFAKWRRYKRLLATSGDLLKRDVVEVLRDFFGLRVDPIDELKEDFKILGKDAVACMGEVKGTNGGLKREHVNQVDSHRERAGLDKNIPGLLIINSQMEVLSIDERLKAQVAKEQIAHASAMNVMVMRTIDFLYFMGRLEASADRGEKLLAILRGGGGWLRADAEDYRLVKD